jgi:hypothetical protein
MTLLWLQGRRATRLEQQIVALQSQIAAGAAARKDDGGLEQQLRSVTDRAEALGRELTRLRSESAALQKQNTELKSDGPTSSTPAPVGDPTVPGLQPPYHYTPDQWDHFVERLNFGKKLGLALLTLAEQNNGQLPESLTPAANWLATNNIPIEGDTGPLFGVGVRSFELVYKGNMKDLANPDHVILAREVNPVEVNAERWTRMYVFADGSVFRLEATRADDFPNREKAVWPGQP